jgi:hypothetical protein
MGDPERRPGRRLIRSRRNALVQHHHDIAPDRLLRLNAEFRA